MMMKIKSMTLVVAALGLTVTESFVPSTTNTISKNSVIRMNTNDDNDGSDTMTNLMGRRTLFNKSMTTVIGGSMALLIGSDIVSPQPANARLESVNRPDLLPSEKGLNVIQIEKYLTTGQAKRMNELLGSLERDTGYRVKVLCQSYPNTPGLAIRDYWDLGKPDQKDDKYVVLVVDQFGGKSNILNFNVGEGVKFALPNVFWQRLANKYGTSFYVRDNGMDIAIINAIEAVVSCLRTEDGFCTSPPDEGQSLKSLGFS